MIIHSAQFIGSFPSNHKMPKANKPEFAFIGRSNVGKSSLINMLTNRTKLAKTSSTPGKTQMINQFIINEEWHIIDLPGYGFAKLSKKHRESLKKMIANYLKERESLITTFVLLDARHSLQKVDEDFLIWLGQTGLPFSIVLTKTDKLKQQDLSKQIKHFNLTLSEYWDPLPPFFTSSALRKRGQNEILAYINSLIKG